VKTTQKNYTKDYTKDFASNSFILRFLHFLPNGTKYSIAKMEKLGSA
jgi:hypothetical protein